MSGCKLAHTSAQAYANLLTEHCRFQLVKSSGGGGSSSGSGNQRFSNKKRMNKPHETGNNSRNSTSLNINKKDDKKDDSASPAPDNDRGSTADSSGFEMNVFKENTNASTSAVRSPGRGADIRQRRTRPSGNEATSVSTTTIDSVCSFFCVTYHPTVCLIFSTYSPTQIFRIYLLSRRRRLFVVTQHRRPALLWPVRCARPS